MGITAWSAVSTISGVLRGTTNQLLTPDNLRGRVSAVNSAFVIGGPQLGQFRSGALAALFGATGSGALGGLGALLCAAGIACIPGVWRFRIGQEPVSPAPVATPLAEKVDLPSPVAPGG